MRTAQTKAGVRRYIHSRLMSVAALLRSTRTTHSEPLLRALRLTMPERRLGRLRPIPALYHSAQTCINGKTARASLVLERRCMQPRIGDNGSGRARTRGCLRACADLAGEDARGGALARRRPIARLQPKPAMGRGCTYLFGRPVAAVLRCGATRRDILSVRCGFRCARVTARRAVHRAVCHASNAIGRLHSRSIRPRRISCSVVRCSRACDPTVAPGRIARAEMAFYGRRRVVQRTLGCMNAPHGPRRRAQLCPKAPTRRRCTCRLRRCVAFLPWCVPYAPSLRMLADQCAVVRLQ